MGDSDDDYDRKRRDKFQGERGDSFRSDRRKDDDWGGRQRVRGDYRDRYQYQGDMPPPKRMRFDQMRYMEYGGGGYGGGGGWGDGGGFPGGSGGRSADLETQPPMMSFKAFLQTQDDSITDEEALSKYAEYKQEFRRQQLNEFFVAHKEEEWFKLKYHPEESTKRKEEVFQSLKRRSEVFMDMYKRGMVDESRLDSDHGDQVIKLLDSVVILLEGGTDLDLTILDQVPPSESNNKVPDKGDETKEKTDDKAETDGKNNKEDKDKEEEEEKKSETGKRKKSQDDDDDDDSGHSEDEEKKIKLDENSHENKDKTENGSDHEDKDKKEKVEGNGMEQEEAGSKKESTDDKSSEKDDVIPLTPRPLHKTSSIFLRTISPRITKAEIEAICKKYPGFLRVSLADPQPEQHWFRRGWATFRRETDIKEICWSLNTIRVKDCELGAIVNRDLSRRVRTVSGISALKQVVLHDLKLCAKLIQGLDSRAGLWADTPKQDEQKSFGLISGNPMLQGITDLLVDEASAEEEELLGSSAEADDSKERSQQALQVLDRLLLYLRIVHSVDFYNQSHYPNEDEMPNRCGIMHLRGTPTNTEVSNQEIQEYTEGFRTKLEALLLPPRSVDEAEMTILGAKSQDSEVEKFVLANTQELAKDKWLCPLSGKKFKGPEFVRKHIFNKFSVELEEVKKEVDYFNNYLRDPKRPQLAEHPGNRGKKEGGGGGAYPEPFPPQFQYGGFRPRGHFSGFVRGSRGFMRGRGMDHRPLITYRDLDAPCEPEEMI